MRMRKAKFRTGLFSLKNKHIIMMGPLQWKQHRGCRNGSGISEAISHLWEVSYSPVPGCVLMQLYACNLLCTCISNIECTWICGNFCCVCCGCFCVAFSVADSPTSCCRDTVSVSMLSVRQMTRIQACPQLCGGRWSDKF